ncbi:TonB-dependent receptor domain-containing protein [Hymenobacter properus]|uniref:TonB-dependent receptor n=1 Tax=Hymenobacter properus TaxID=2791026 RepID=A0A931FQF6_9BACT|nr:TonB-dependent receptor [Hymenobacter properus]MBF9144539.1 TonB-dependent receptor [Hymenobacter properus]MBR7723357.1 TonB-dependent receptor [Microvirga sp. SRT04]
MLRKKMMPRLGLLLGLWWGMGLAAHAQSGTVRGTLLEVGTGNPVSFASVVLLRAADSTFVAGTQASEVGAFELAPLPLGQYVLRATAVGYRTGRRVISLTAGAPVLALGTLRLRTSATQLTDVVVTAERAVVTGGLDKKVVDVSKDLTVSGGTAIDVLQNVPSVTVDQTGAVSIRGSSGVTIFIDGKPTGTTLDQIPASSIQSVEVVTNPSARYDASGAGGILNIVLKKEQRNGLNGQATALVGTGDKYNAALSLNYRKGNLNWFGSYDFRRDHRRINGTLDQTTRTGADNLVLHQDRSGTNLQTSHAARLGFDYALTPEQTLTLAVQPRFNPLANDETLDSRQVNTAQGNQVVPAGTSRRGNASTGTFRSADVTADYRRVWEQHKGRELTASAVYTPLLADNDVVSNILYADNRLVQQQRTTTRTQQGTAQVDYVHPLGEKSRFEVGARSSLRQYDIDYHFSSVPTLGFDPSNRFIYNQYVQAAYGIYAGAKGNFSYQAGLRAEQTNLDGNQVATSEKFTQQYLAWFPSAVLAYELPHEQRVQASYAKRIQRPDAGELNPFTDRSDQLNLATGNPQLLPEYVHSVELGHEISFASGRSLNSTAFYRVETNTAQGFRRVITDPLTGNLVTSTTRQNLGTETTYGLELVGASPLTAWWKANATASTFRRLIVGASLDGTPINTASQVFTTRLNNVFTLGKRLDAQVALNYRSPINSAQGTRSGNFNVDFATKYNVLGDRGTLTLRVADIFNTLHFDFTAYGTDLATASHFKRESRIAFLGFTYRFGQNRNAKPDKKQREDEGGGFE